MFTCLNIFSLNIQHNRERHSRVTLTLFTFFVVFVLNCQKWTRNKWRKTAISGTNCNKSDERFVDSFLPSVSLRAKFGKFSMWEKKSNPNRDWWVLSSSSSSVAQYVACCERRFSTANTVLSIVKKSWLFSFLWDIFLLKKIEDILFKIYKKN